VVAIRPSGCPPSEEGVRAIERRIRATLPEDYRKFLIEVNGGRPLPDVIDVPGLPGSPTDIQYFFAVGPADEPRSIEWNIEFARSRLHQPFLPIACDSGSGVFCLSLAAADFGSVYFWESRLGGSASVSPPPLFRVASDFTSMLAAIR
jgi:hypothetical protein